MIKSKSQRTFVFEDTSRRDYKYIREGLLRRGWKQIALPRSQPGATFKRQNSCWIHRGDAVGVASAGVKDVTTPDLIWTLSCGRSPPLSIIGPKQATNLFGTSSCLTTKAGLCRTLQAMGFGGSATDEDVVGPSQSFFPRCFDLSYSSQLDDFKDNFRQTAAAVILKVFCRSFAETSSSVASRFIVDNRVRQINTSDNAEPEHHSPFLKCCGAIGQSDEDDCKGDVHLWMLALAVRACRRRLLEMSGWREEVSTRKGTSPNANGAMTLTDSEWESLLLYSYILRRVAHHNPEAAGDSNRHQDHGQKVVAGRDPRGLEGKSWGQHYSRRAAPTGWPVLCGTQSNIVRNENCIHERRPSSAPVKRNIDTATMFQRRHRFSHRQPTAIKAECCCTRGHQSVAGGSWGAAETIDLRKGLMKIWGTSASDGKSAGCGCPCGVGGGRDWNLTKIDSDHVSQLGAEAIQLHTMLERRCPQWTIDGDRNLWMLKPAGASKGQGVRVAWTLDQILCAQKTMGGRVVQKYIEAPLLFSHGSQRRSLSNGSRCEDDISRQGSHVQLSGTCAHNGVESCARVRRPGSNGNNFVGGTDSDSAANTSMAVSSDRVDDTYAAIPHGERTSTPSTPLQGLPRDAERIGIDSNTPAGAKKFDIRTWVLVTGWDPLEAFVFDECYLRVCPQDFTLCESKFTDPEVHLTNLSARRPAGEFSKTFNRQGQGQIRRGRRRKHSRLSSTSDATDNVIQKNKAPVGEGVDILGRTDGLSIRESAESHARGRLGERWVSSDRSKDTLAVNQAELFRTLGEMDGVGVRRAKERGKGEVCAAGERLWKKKIWPSIEGVVRSTLVAAQPHVRPRTPSFQLFGFDLLLDRQLRPWLLEVNLSPALSHTSKHQSAVIRCMCEGLLRLTVDRIFPMPQSSTLSGLGSDTPESINTPEIETEGGTEVNRAHPFGKWRLITTATSTVSRSEQSGTLSSTLRDIPKVDAHLGAISTSTQMLSLQGRHLTRRSLARAERGVLEATAVKLLAAWWRSKAEDCRIKRSRKLRATAEISKWLIKLIVRRRALLAINKRSARVIQKLWRRALSRISETRRLAVACVVVQTMWRQRQYNRRCNSRRIRHNMLSGFQSWARETLSRRRRAEKAILRAVIAATRRQIRKRHAAAVIIRGLERACNRRRWSRLRLQVRLVSISSARVARVERNAAIVIAKAIRRGAARSAITRAIVAAGKLQDWYRRVLLRSKQLHASAMAVQQVWRRAKLRRMITAGKLGCNPDAYSPHHFLSSSENDLQISLAPSTPKGAVAFNTPTSARNQHTYTRIVDPTINNIESGNGGEIGPHNDVSGAPLAEYSHPSALCNDLLSSAESVDGEWVHLHPCLADGGTHSRHKRSSRNSAVVPGDGHPRTNASPRGCDPSPGAVSTEQEGGPCANGEFEQQSRRLTPKKFNRNRGVLAKHQCADGILNLEEILPDLKRCGHNERLLENKGRDRFEVFHQRKRRNSGAWQKTQRTKETQGLGNTRAMAEECCCDAGVPYPPAGAAQPVYTRAPCCTHTRRQTQTQNAREKANAAVEPLSYVASERNQSGKETQGVSRAPPPLSFGFSKAQQDEILRSSFGRNRARINKKIYGTTTINGPSRARPLNRCPSAKENTMTLTSRRVARYGSAMLSSVQYNGESGGILELLAFIEK